MPDDLAFLETTEFQTDVERQMRRWDDEWVAYWGRHKSYVFKYFMNLRNATRNDFNWPEPRVNQMTERDFYHFSPFEYYSFAIWVRGRDVPNSVIAELGCGPGLLGKVIAHFCRGYIGLDYSRLALYLARLVSPCNCRYLHLSETGPIRALQASVDVCVGRFFFIHQNLANTHWILRLFRYLLRDGGVVSADFYATAEGVKRPQVVLKPEDPLKAEFPSCVFAYEDSHIAAIADRCGFDLESVDYQPQMQRRFAVLRKAGRS